MKKIGIMQPYFLPYLGYWQLIGAVDVYVVFDDVNYIKRGWINRNRIRLSNGEVSYIRLPVSKASQNKLICDHSISNLEETKATLLKTLEYNYKKRPNYIEGLQLIENVFNTENDNLADFLFRQIELVSKYFHFDTQIIRSSDLNNDKSLLGQEKIIDIVKLLQGDIYINAIGGISLYHSSRFKEEKLQLQFLDPSFPPYDQGINNFIPALSVLDLVMNCSSEEAISMMRDYELIAPDDVEYSDELLPD